jgi:hypothetical protein
MRKAENALEVERLGQLPTVGRSASASGTGIGTNLVASAVIVAADGSGHFTNLTEALRNAGPGSRLVVREGIYEESVLLAKDVEIVGDGRPENIVVRGTYSSALVTRTGKAIVRGLTLQGRGRQNAKAFFAVEISGGEMILENCLVSSDTLSGVAVYGAGVDPLIRNCRIQDCADSGLYIFDNARGRIEDCEIFRNANVNVAINAGAAPTILNSRIYEGENGGVVVWGNGTAGMIEGCRIAGHRLANVGVREYADPTFRRCEIYGGRDAGIYIHHHAHGTFEECDVSGNSGAGVGASGNGNSVLRGCAVHDGGNSGVIVRDQGRLLIENCGIYDNLDAGIAVAGRSTIAVRRSNINGNGTVAVRVKAKSSARVEGCDLGGNRIATWETEYGVTVEEKNNRQ